MVVRVGGSFAYLGGDGMLTFDDEVQTVGDLRNAIERTTKIPGVKQVRVESSRVESPRERVGAGVELHAALRKHVMCVLFCAWCGFRMYRLEHSKRL